MHATQKNKQTNKQETKNNWVTQKGLFAQTNHVSTFSHTRENSKMFNITWEYFSFFNNKPPAS